MREAVMMLDVRDDNPALHVTLRRELADKFGGYTVHEAHGGWMDHGGVMWLDRVAVYTVAMEDTAYNAATFRTIAETFGRLNNQQAMYVRHASQDVEIFDILPLEERKLA